MADADLSTKDNKVTPVTTGLGENNNAATDSGNAETKPAATAVEPGHNSMNPTVEDVESVPSSPDSLSVSDPEADKTTLPAEIERQAAKHLRYQTAMASVYGQPNYYGVPPKHIDLGYGNYVSEFGGYGGQQQGYGSFGQSMYAQPHHYGMSRQDTESGRNYVHHFGGLGGQSQGYGRFGRSMYDHPQSQGQQSRYGEASNSGHSTPNPALGNQLPSGPASQSHHQGHNQQSQHGSYPYNHSYYNNPYYADYMNQFGGYGGQQQGYGTFGRSMYGQSHRYGMSPQTAYDQRSAVPANVGVFGGASANERGTNNGVRSTNTHSANTSNSGQSANNRRHPPTTNMQPGMQRPPMEPQRSPMDPVAFTYSSILQGQSRDDVLRSLAARYLNITDARVDDSANGPQDDTSTVSTDETGILTPTTTEAGDSEAEARN